MRNLLLALLLANILYFMWGRFVEQPPESGVAVVSESALGPPLQMAVAKVSEMASAVTGGSAEPNVEDVVADADNPIEIPKIKEFIAQVGRSCVTVGPFRKSADASGALAQFESDDMDAALRSTQAEVFVGHWVQIRNIDTRASGNEMIKQLHDAGLGDAYLVVTEDEGMKISLGLFGEMAGAEKVELQAKSLGLPADITPRMQDAMVTFVDVGLPPGRGAGAIVERYGEDRVLLRSKATCPGS